MALLHVREYIEADLTSSMLVDEVRVQAPLRGQDEVALLALEVCLRTMSAEALFVEVIDPIYTVRTEVVELLVRQVFFEVGLVKEHHLALLAPGMVLAVLAVRVDGVVGGELNLAETTEEFVVNGHDVLSEQKRHFTGRFSRF